MGIKIGQSVHHLSIRIWTNRPCFTLAASVKVVRKATGRCRIRVRNSFKVHLIVAAISKWISQDLRHSINSSSAPPTSEPKTSAATPCTRTKAQMEQISINWTRTTIYRIAPFRLTMAQVEISLLRMRLAPRTEVASRAWVGRVDLRRSKELLAKILADLAQRRAAVALKSQAISALWPIKIILKALKILTISSRTSTWTILCTIRNRRWGVISRIWIWITPKGWTGGRITRHWQWTISLTPIFRIMLVAIDLRPPQMAAMSSLVRRLLSAPKTTTRHRKLHTSRSRMSHFKNK